MTTSPPLELLLRSSAVVAGGFLGHDQRAVQTIVATDAAELARLGCTHEQLAARMAEITAKARPAQGASARIDDRIDARVDDARGLLACPWGCPHPYLKSVTTISRRGTTASIHWSDLGVHLIAAHGFFQGQGSPFRLEPRDLVNILYASKEATMDKYVCQACGYIYDPQLGEKATNTPPKTPFDQLPETWKCPMCGAPKRMFKKQKA